MPILTDRLEFYHVPRTGGSWLAKRLARWHKRIPIGFHKVGESHDMPLAKRDEEAERVRFTITREPFEWLKSWYRCKLAAHLDKRTWCGGVPHGLMFSDCPLDEGFRTYLQFYLAAHPGRASSIWLTYMERTDVWLRTDRLTEGLKELFAHVDMTELELDRLAPGKGFNSTPDDDVGRWPCDAPDELIDRWKMAEAPLYDAYEAAWDGNDANLYDNNPTD